MTRSNRLFNRLLIALVGLALLAGAAWATARLTRFGTAIPLGDVARPGTQSLWIVSIAAMLIIVLCLLWIFSRGKGRTSRLLSESDESGGIEIDSRVVTDLVQDALSGNPDVISVRSAAYRVRRAVALELTLVVRRGADLEKLLASAKVVVSDLDAVLERRVPIVLHVASGVRASFTHEQRVR